MSQEIASGATAAPETVLERASEEALTPIDQGRYECEAVVCRVIRRGVGCLAHPSSVGGLRKQ